MLLEASDFKVKKESGAPPTKKKRRTTPAQSTCAKRNAQRSTGPRDTSRTRLNAMTHGCCSELPVLMPGENPQDVQNKINRYITQLGAATEPEQDGIEVAVMNFIRGRRANKADVAHNTRVVNDVLNNFEDQQALRCADLVENLADSPSTCIIALRSFTHGIHHLLQQIELLDEHLRTSRSFHPSQRVLAIHLCGRRPQDLFTDELVRQWDIDYLSGLHGPGKISAAQAAQLLGRDRPADMDPGEFERRLGGWLQNLDSIEEGRALLKQGLADARRDLLERLKEVEAREVIDRALAVQQAMQSVNAQCMKYLRYRRECERGTQAALRLVLQLQRMRLDYGDQLGETLDEDEPAPAPTGDASDSRPQPGVETEGESPAPGTEEAVYRNEAGATQVAGGSGGNNEPRTISAVKLTSGGSDAAPPRKTDNVALRFRPVPGGYEVLRE
jgi:hypothetical protein